MRLTDVQKSDLASAIKAFPEGQAELSRKMGVSKSVMSRLANQTKPSISSSVLREMVRRLGLDSADYFAQIEIDLDDDRIAEIQADLASGLSQLGREIKTLRGSSFTAFVGIRVAGSVEKVYESQIPLRAAARRGTTRKTVVA